MLRQTPTRAQAASPISHPLDDLHAWLDTGMTTTNATILARLQSPVETIPAVAEYLIAAGGKRIRPLLTLACAAMYDADGARTPKLAAAVEFIHSATLLHDDVVDGSDVRRGQTAANLVYGNQAAVLVGDFLFARAFELMVETENLRVLHLLSQAARIIAEGEVLQLKNAQDLSITMDDYLAVISAKTAALFAAAAACGPALADASEAAQNALYTYGHHLGIAFQIADDILDYTGDTDAFGKERGNDFREGKVTAPVIFALAHATTTERDFWRAGLVDQQDMPQGLDQAIAYLRAHDAFHRAHQMAEDHAALAVEALAGVPDHPLRPILGDLAIFAARRQV